VPREIVDVLVVVAARASVIDTDRMGAHDLERAHIALWPLGPGHASLIRSRGWARSVGHRVDGLAAREQGLRPGGSADVCQGPELRIGVGEVSGAGQVTGVAAVEVVAAGRDAAATVAAGVVRDDGVLQ